MKRTLLFTVVTAVVIATFLASCAVPAATPAPAAPEQAAPAETPTPAPEKQLVFATVVKSIAFMWFKRLEQGVLQFGEDYGVKAFMEGPSQADSAAQVAIIEDLIAQGVDAICNVPYGVPENEPVQKKAMDAGIIVVGHEAATAKEGTLHYDVEAFDNCAYGEEMLKEMVARMGEEGKYIQFVGSLTNASHNEWQDCAKAYAEKNYPKLQWIAKYESKEDFEVAYNTMKDVLRTHPDIKGVLGSAAGDVVGAGRAIEEAGLQDAIAVVGTSIPSYAGELLKTGAVDLAMAWDPATAGYACNVVAYKVLKGEEITDGMNLGVPGYEKIVLRRGVNGVPVIYGSAWIKINAQNMDQYPF
ncbi:MAG: autoinducer 2 ABC transporter substrate-binding protein [Anaerolineae bacterium]|nr:autoinducer 2 ABC transporter substrate-binding protein [Anaerolineae bacterium]MDW8100718.1 autoinducer 2 ABC transporter substrate-binding protein [Anaerolineae bacterium]